MQIDEPAGAEWFDGVRYHVPSASRPHVTYLVELTDYGCNGSCQCEAFQFNLGPLLARRMTPAQAIEQKLVKIKKGTPVEDALRCPHIISARRTFAQEVLVAITRKFKRTRT